MRRVKHRDISKEVEYTLGMSRDYDIREFLAGEGFGNPDAQEAALQVLYAANLTRPGKARFAEPKLAAAREALASALVLTCSAAACQDEARQSPERTRVPAADRRHCEICGGSDNQHAIDALVKVAVQKKCTRLLVIGGSPSTREELDKLIKGRIEYRGIDGTLRRTQAQAHADMGWAHLVMIWGSTELAHRVSMLYTRAPGQSCRVVSCPKRGIVALAQAAVRALS